MPSLLAFEIVPPVSGWQEGFEAHIWACNLVSAQAKAKLAQQSCSAPDRSKTASLQCTQDHSSDIKSSSCRRSSPGTGFLSKEQQQRFESDLWKLRVANNFSWLAVNQPQTHIFFQTWLPGAKLSDHHKLSGLILQNEAKVFNESMHDVIKGQVATGMSDGWKKIKHNSLLASMLSIDYKVGTSQFDSFLWMTNRLFLRHIQLKYMISQHSTRPPTITCALCLMILIMLKRNKMFVSLPGLQMQAVTHVPCESISTICDLICLFLTAGHTK